MTITIMTPVDPEKILLALARVMSEGSDEEAESA